MREDPGPAQDDEPGVVRDQIQPPVAQFPRPADPAVPMAALERARLPPGEREPPLAPRDDVAQSPAGKPLEAEVVVAVDLLVPPAPLVGTRQADGHLAEGEPLRPGRENLGGRRCHAASLAHRARKSQRPQERPGVTGRVLAASLAWDGPAPLPDGGGRP